MNSEQVSSTSKQTEINEEITLVGCFLRNSMFVKHSLCFTTPPYSNSIRQFSPHLTVESFSMKQDFCNKISVSFIWFKKVEGLNYSDLKFSERVYIIWIKPYVPLAFPCLDNISQEDEVNGSDWLSSDLSLMLAPRQWLFLELVYLKGNVVGMESM